MNEGHIFIDDVITPDTLSQVKRALAEFSGKEKIVLHIQSPGGSVYAGYNIYHALKASKKPIRTIIEGEAQSMATFIALAGDEIEICNPSVFMIHNPHNEVQGTADQFEQGASELRNIENDMVAAYAAKTKLPEEKIREMMKNTTSMTASQAKEFGFVDKVLGSYSQAVALGQTIKKQMKNENESILAQAFSKLGALFMKAGHPIAMDLTTADGKTIVLSEDGKTATIDGQPAQGSYTLSDGSTIVCDNGTVVSKTGAASAPPPAQPQPQPQPPAPAPPAPAPPVQTAEQKALAEALAKLATMEAEKQALEAAKLKAEAEAKTKDEAVVQMKAIVEDVRKKTVGDDNRPFEGYAPMKSPQASSSAQAKAKGIEATMAFLNENFSWLKQYYPESHFAKYASGPNMTSILETNFNYTYPGILTTDIFYKPMIEGITLSDLFTIDQGIKWRKKYNLVTQLDNILKPYGGCTRVFNNNRQLITNTTVETKEFNVAESWCKDDFTGLLSGQFNILAEEWLKTGNKSFDPTGTPIATVIDKILVEALQRDVLKRACFAAGNSSSDSYNQFDGLWDRLIDSSGASNYCVRRAGSSLGTGDLSAGNALTYLEQAYAQSNILLKTLIDKNQATFWVTRSIWDNYYNSLIGTGAVTEAAFADLKAGLKVLTYKGIAVKPVNLWDVWLTESTNPLFATTRHLILLTTKANHILGVEQASDLNKIEGWYERKDRKFYYEADMKMGYNYLHCDLQTILY
jgi:ATP-dependent Clp protease protease subunit